jgi:polyketide cyclase/dehydrase/lipid transport protein
MISASWQIQIDKPPEQVFDYVADLDSEPEWNPDTSNIVKKTDGDVGLGTVFTEEFERIGTCTTTIDVFERPSNLGFDARNPKCDALVRFHFVAAAEDSTTVSCDVDLAFKGTMKFLAPLMAGKVRKSIETERGPALKRAVEARAA